MADDASTAPRDLPIWAMGKGGDGNWGMYLCPDLAIPGPEAGEEAATK